MPTDSSKTVEPDRSSDGRANRLSRLLERPYRIVQSFNAREGLKTAWLIAGFAIALLLIFLRDPSLFTNPQFWAEDGKVWYAQAYNQGWLHSLTLSLSGYLCTLPRLGAGVALLVPFRWAPLVMALEGLLFQALPVPILLSTRCRNWAPLSFRLLFAVVYVAIPNARDVHIVCTNTLWHLALVGILLAFADAPRSLFGCVFDIILFALATVSGPFAIMLLPFVFVFWWARRQRWSLITILVLVPGSILQVGVLLHHMTERHARFLGATVARLIRIVGGDIFLGALRGSIPEGYRHSALVCLIPLLIGLAVIAYCWRATSVEVRLFFLYCFALFAVSLRAPMLPPTPFPPWEAILRVASIRYWYFPSLVFLWSLLWCAFYARSFVARASGILLTLVLIQGIVRDWWIPPFVDLHFPEYAEQFEAASPGTYMKIPLNPSPEWFMEITKK